MRPTNERRRGTSAEIHRPPCADFAAKSSAAAVICAVAHILRAGERRFSYSMFLRDRIGFMSKPRTTMARDRGFRTIYRVPQTAERQVLEIGSKRKQGGASSYGVTPNANPRPLTSMSRCTNSWHPTRFPVGWRRLPAEPKIQHPAACAWPAAHSETVARAEGDGRIDFADAAMTTPEYRLPRIPQRTPLATQRPPIRTRQFKHKRIR